MTISCDYSDKFNFIIGLDKKGTPQYFRIKAFKIVDF